MDRKIIARELVSLAKSLSSDIASKEEMKEEVEEMRAAMKRAVGGFSNKVLSFTRPSQKGIYWVNFNLGWGDEIVSSKA